MSIEASIVVPVILLIMAIVLVSFAQVSEQAFYDQEEGAAFILTLAEGSSLNGYEPSFSFLNIQMERRFTGTQCTYKGTKSEFTLFKPSRILYGVLFGNLFHGGAEETEGLDDD